MQGDPHRPPFKGDSRGVLRRCRGIREANPSLVAGTPGDPVPRRDVERARLVEMLHQDPGLTGVTGCRARGNHESDRQYEHSCLPLQHMNVNARGDGSVPESGQSSSAFLAFRSSMDSWSAASCAS